MDRSADFQSAYRVYKIQDIPQPMNIKMPATSIPLEHSALLRVPVPKGRSIIARRFNAGTKLTLKRVPKGRLISLPSLTLPQCRPGKAVVSN